MKHIILNKEFQWGGLPATDLYILGATRGAAGASDFTDADTSQQFTLETPAAGDVVLYPLAVAYTKVGFVGGALSAVALDVGFTGSLEYFVKDGAMFAANAVAAPVITSDTGGPKAFDGATAMTAVVATTGANLSAITAGEIWIYACIARRTQYLDQRTT